jgi:hypothetical protein
MRKRWSVCLVEKEPGVLIVLFFSRPPDFIAGNYCFYIESERPAPLSLLLVCAAPFMPPG